MLGGNTSGEAIWATECDCARLDAATHIVGFSTRIDNLINGLHLVGCQFQRILFGGRLAYCKIPGHKLNDRVQSSKGSSHAEAGEAVLRNPFGVA